ncbi:hypothetical protein NE865_00496 [Phthorimaea operculella]|nr:hypothetical protein NE865_00496 [Phthorimaea operculella]
MATWSIISTVVLVAALSVAASSEPEKCPPGNPLCNLWQPCDYQGEVEVSCRDCSTRVICTPQGGWISPCWLPGLQHCADGSCVRQPSPECRDQPESTPGLGTPTARPEETTLDYTPTQ